jgi:hypothetical protein
MSPLRLMRCVTMESIDAYRTHPDHSAVAERIEAMEQHGIGVDFTPRGHGDHSQ